MSKRFGPTVELRIGVNHDSGDHAHCWLDRAANALDQEANGIGFGRCRSVPAQVPDCSGVLDWDASSRRHCGRFSFVNNNNNVVGGSELRLAEVLISACRSESRA